MSIDSKELFTRLIQDLGYPPAGAQLLVNKLEACSPAVKEALALWWNTGQVSDLEVEGYTMARLMSEHSMKPIAALLTLDWLSREPEKAKISLRKGHDSVRPPAKG